VKPARAGVPRAHDAVDATANPRTLVLVSHTAAGGRQRQPARSARNRRVTRSEFRPTELMDALVENATEGIVLLSREGDIVYASPSTTSLLGYAVDDLVGRSIFELMHPDDLSRVQSLFGSILERAGARAAGEFRFRSADGSWLWLEGSGTNRLDMPGIDAIVGAYRPLDRETLEPSEFDVLEGQFRVLIENAVHITAIVGPDGSIRYISPVVERMLGCAPSELRGTSWFDLIHPDDVATVRERFALRVQHPGVGQFTEFRTRHRDGSWRVLEGIASNRLDDPLTRGIVIDARDVTERKWTADRLQHSLDALLAIHDVGRQVGSSVEQRAIASALADGAQRVAAVDSAVILLKDLGGRLRLVHERGSNPPWAEVRRSRAGQAARRRALSSGSPQHFRVHLARERRAGLEALCLPLRAHERAIGILEAYGPRLAGEASNDALRILADQAASAFERARLHADLAERERRLEEVRRRLLLSHEEERRRIAYDIHDGLAQVAFAAHQQLEVFAARYRGRASRQRAVLQQALALTSRTVADARRVISGLRPIVLEEHGLGIAIAGELQALTADGWEIDFMQNLGTERLAQPIETALFRVAQEALTNVRVHAGTRRVAVSIDRQRRMVRLEVRDWGRGFRPAAALRAAGPAERVGLAGMQDRVSLLHGRCEIRSRPGAGTRIVAEVPLPTSARVTGA